MFIAIVDLRTHPNDRAAARDRLVAEQPAVRAMPGCVDFRVYESLEDAGRLTVLHEWDDEASFATYTASSEFERSGQVIRPLVVEPSVSRRFRADIAETVN